MIKTWLFRRAYSVLVTGAENCASQVLYKVTD